MTRSSPDIETPLHQDELRLFVDRLRWLYGARVLTLDMHKELGNSLDKIVHYLDELVQARRSLNPAQTPLGLCTQAELDAFEGLDSKSKQLFSMWVDRALKAEKALATQPQASVMRPDTTVDRVVFRMFAEKFTDVPSAFATTQEGKEWRLSTEEIKNALNLQPMLAQPQTPPTDRIELIAVTMIEDMFAPHELPVDEELWHRYLETARKVATALSHCSEGIVEVCAKIAEEGIEEMENDHRMWREGFGKDCAQPYDDEIAMRRRIAEKIRALAVTRPHRGDRT